LIGGGTCRAGHCGLRREGHSRGCGQWAAKGVMQTRLLYTNVR
jgi:hypothetical protein